MIPLPPGCRVNYAITLEVDKLSTEMVEWFELIGGTISENEYWDSRGRRQTVKYVQYGKAKRCHYRQDGSSGVRIHFHGDDAVTASVFLIKFNEHIQQHNMKDYTNV